MQRAVHIVGMYLTGYTVIPSLLACTVNNPICVLVMSPPLYLTHNVIMRQVKKAKKVRAHFIDVLQKVPYAMQTYRNLHTYYTTM